MSNRKKHPLLRSTWSPPGRVVEKIMKQSGVDKSDAEWGLQYNLTHASICAPRAIRCGLDQKIKEVISTKYEWMKVGDGIAFCEVGTK